MIILLSRQIRLFSISIVLFILHIHSGKSQGTNKRTIVKIGIYTDENATLHSGLLTDIAKYYIQEDKKLSVFIDPGDTNNLRQKKYLKSRFDSANVIERAFSLVASLANLTLNKPCFGSNNSVLIQFFQLL